jgi:hypothetical protein
MAPSSSPRAIRHRLASETRNERESLRDREARPALARMEFCGRNPHCVDYKCVVNPWPTHEGCKDLKSATCSAHRQTDILSQFRGTARHILSIYFCPPHPLRCLILLVLNADLSTSPASTIRWAHRHNLTGDARGNQSYNSNYPRLPLNTSARNTPQYGSTTASSYAPRRYSTPVIDYQPTTPSCPSSPMDSRLRSSTSAFFQPFRRPKSSYDVGKRF